MCILILYREVMGYTVAGINQLASEYSGKIVLVEDRKSKLTAFESEYSQLTYVDKTELSDQSLFDYCIGLKADLVLCAGWIDQCYMKICKTYLRQGIATVCLFDTIWTGSTRQRMAKYTAPFYLKKHFKYMWGSGQRQYEFAKRVGYKHEFAKTGCYTSDVSLFSMVENHYDAKNILFVGRFVPEKGIDKLLSAFTLLSTKYPEWTLTLVGSGKINVDGNSNQIIIKEFLQPQDLVGEFANASFLCLPSTFEPWGVVLHEAAAAGLPILCSASCGASDSFLRDGYNGKIIHNPLSEELDYLMSLPVPHLELMGKRSRMLAVDYNPQIWASTILRILENEQR